MKVLINFISTQVNNHVHEASNLNSRVPSVRTTGSSSSFRKSSGKKRKIFLPVIHVVLDSRRMQVRFRPSLFLTEALFKSRRKTRYLLSLRNFKKLK